MDETTGKKHPHRTAFYGGSFDPVHRAHLEIARTLIPQFELDEFTFIPAFHAPHKVRLTPTSAYDRYAMLCLATQHALQMSVSRIEIEAPERPYTLQTLARLNSERPDDEKFFVMGADSWMEITTWREWETVLNMSNHIVITRPGVEISFDHVTDQIAERIVDLRKTASAGKNETQPTETRIYITDSVDLDISATQIRQVVRAGDRSWHALVAPEVANYIEKYQIYN
ncbi:MAG TPA: nicotinate-nucleotide adenylyltransferase [Pyrinomonadaceae bacterium]|nr:nicotinate-nucleotide adenylyltransferase [Pyrinomonadaceae bacterium]